MNGLEALLGSMEGRQETVYPVGEELAKIRDGFNHISDLKPGEKVRHKSAEYKDVKLGGNDGIFEVFRVLPSFLPGAENGSNHQGDEVDFTVMTIRAGVFYEACLDSRRFERVTE